MSDSPRSGEEDLAAEGMLARLRALLGGRTAPREKPRRIHVIINPAAGTDQPILKTLNLACQEAGVDWEVFVTKQAGDGMRLAREAWQAGVDAVAVHGGDGTVMEVASGLVQSGVPLAIIPGGTANVMARELGVPIDLVEACALAAGEPARIRKVDVGEIGEHRFLLRASAGLEAAMIEGAPRPLKDRYGILAYAISALQALADPESALYRLRLDGEEVERPGITCIIANSGATGSPRFTLSPTIRVDDGLLDVLVIQKSDLATLLSLAASVVGGQENAAALEHWQAREVEVVADPPQVLQADGEIIGQTPVKARVIPQALEVIVPAEGGAA